MKVDAEQLRSTARIWIYQSREPFSPDVETAIRERLDGFVAQWVAHNQPLAATSEVYHQRFIVLMVDEAQNVASGCSIDTSVGFIRELEQEFGLSLFDRMTFSYQKEGEVFTVPRQRFSQLYEAGEIDQSTLVFDNLVKTKEEFDTRWLRPLGESWHKRFV